MLAAIWLKAAIRLDESLATKACVGVVAQLFSRLRPAPSIGSEGTLKPIV